LNNLGLVLHGLGRHHEADEAFRAAEAVHESRPDGPGAPGDARADLAVALSNHGILLKQMGRRSDARKAYERAIRLTEEAVVLRPDLRSLKRQGAFARSNLAGLLMDENDRTGAEEQAELAVRLMAALVDEMPSVPEYQAALAGLTQLLRIAKNESLDPRTLAASTAAVNLFRRHVADHPETADGRRNLGRGLLAHARILGEAKKPDEALAASREAVEVFTRLRSDHPDEATYRLDLAQTAHELGNLLYSGQKFPEAEAAYRLDLEACELLAATSPDVAEYRERIGRASYTVGMAIDGTNRPAASLPHYDRAIALLVAPVSANSAQRVNREALRNAYWGRAECLLGLGRPKEAVPAWRAMLTLIPETAPDHRTYRLRLAQTLLQSGDRPAAAAEIAAVANDPRATPQQKKAAAAIRVTDHQGPNE
jgi:tetratricopeptide (TPR) repeat protein